MAAAGKMQRHTGDQPADRHCHLIAFDGSPRPRQRYDLRLGFLGLRKSGIDYGSPGGEPLADRNVKILDASAVEVLEDALERPLGKLLAFLTERLLHDGPPEIEILGALLGADKTADAGARLAGDDLDLVAVAELGAQRNHPAVYLRSDAPVADL